MAFDYKKEYKEFYLPKEAPSIIQIPTMNFIAIQGEGDPNAADGAYKRAIEKLYAVSYTLKMSKKGQCKIQGYFDYVVPPLEGFWWQKGKAEIDYSNKETFNWISVIRLPDFITEGDVTWAKEEAIKKKKNDFSPVKFMTYTEGLVIQCMHFGSYDSEPLTVAHMHEVMKSSGYELDFSNRRHHEIYLSDPRKCEKENLKTIIRHPIKRIN